MDSVRKLLTIGDLTWPISYRYHISTPFGGTQLELDVDAPSLWEDQAASRRLGLIIWAAAIAPAISTQVVPTYLEVVCWKVSTLPTLAATPTLIGLALGRATDRQDAGMLVLNSGHGDAYSLRRLSLPGIPRRWVEDHVLNEDGAAALQERGRVLMLGMGEPAGASDPQLLLRHSNAIPAGDIGFPTPGFRRIEHVRVLYHTEPAPTPGPDLWP